MVQRWSFQGLAHKFYRDSLFVKRCYSGPVISNPYIQKQPFKTVNLRNTKEFFSNCKKSWPPSYARNELPKEHTDIRGLDNTAYAHAKKIVFKKIPNLLMNHFFGLKFIPLLHYICTFRKSNIAYTFSNRGGSLLNDPELEKLCVRYRGRYRNLSFFLEKHYPLDSAVIRSKYRKFIRKTLFQVLHELSPQDIDLVKGIFCFHFKIFPTTQSDKLLAKKYLYNAVQNVIEKKDVTYFLRLGAAVKQQNAAYKKDATLIKEVRKANYFSGNTTCFYPKLPFFNKTGFPNDP